MTKLQKISRKDPKRLKTLKNRRERLIELNLNYGYTQSGNEKIDQYYRCILYIRKQISIEECKNVHPLKTRASNVFQGFLNPKNGLTLRDFRNLTNPNYATK